MKLSFLFFICSFVLTACNPTTPPPTPKASTSNSGTSNTELEEPSSATIDQNAVKPDANQTNEDLDTEKGSGSAPEIFDEEEDYEEEYIDEELIDDNVQRMEKNGSNMNDETDSY